MFAASQADIRRVDNSIDAKAIAVVKDAAWWDVLGRFRQVAARLDQLYRQLLADRDYVMARPALAADWAKIMARVAPLRQKIASITAGADKLVAWVRGSPTLSGLGLLPLIPIAIVAAALSLATKWVLDAVALSKRIAEQKRLEAAGVDPERAADIVTRTAGDGGMFAGIGKTATIVGVVGLAGFGAYLYLQHRRHA